MGLWKNYILAGIFLSIFIIVHPSEGYRANPELVLRHRRETETVAPIVPEPIQIDTAKNTNNSDVDTISSETKTSKPVTRNRGKIKYQSSLLASKVSEKLPSVKEENEKKSKSNVIRSRQYRNVSETTLADTVTESSTTKKMEIDTILVTTNPSINVVQSDIWKDKSDQDINNSNVEDLQDKAVITQNPAESITTEATTIFDNQSSNITSKENITEIPSIDISKFLSEDFHNKDYQLSSHEDSTFMSLQVHDPVEAVKGIHPVDLFRFEDELTTPKTVIFDEHHTVVKDNIKNNLAANGGEDISKVDLGELIEKSKTDNNTKVQILTVKELYSNDKIGDDGHIHKELITTNGTKVEYETSKLENNLKDLEKDKSEEVSEEINKSVEVTEINSEVVTSQNIQDNSTKFVNNLDVKVREVFPELSTPTPKTDAHTPANVITIPVVDLSSNTSYPRLRISVKANKPIHHTDSETTEKLIIKAVSRGQKSYIDSTPKSNEDPKSANEIQQAQETIHGTTKSFRQINSFANEDDNDKEYGMNLPDNADAWSLIGMKHVPTQKRNISIVTDPPINVKELLDWSEIMKNEGNSSTDANSTSTPKNIINFPTESQAAENKLIPVQVPAPTKTPTLVVENNIPSNDITTIKPEEVIETNIAHTTVRTTKDYGDNLQFNRVDDFEIISPSANIEKINITFKNSPIINMTNRSNTIKTESSTSATTMIIPPVVTVKYQEITTSEGNRIQTTLLHSMAKDHKKHMTIEEVKTEMFPEKGESLTTESPSHTTSNILEFHKTSTMPNIVMMSPTANDETNTLSDQEINSTTENSDYEMRTSIINVQKITEITTEVADDDHTTAITNSPSSYEMMFNDSPSLPTESNQEYTTLKEEFSTSITDSSATETYVSESYTTNTPEASVTETETSVTENANEYATEISHTVTETSIPETTLYSNSEMDESTRDNVIVKITNFPETVQNEKESTLTTLKPIITTIIDTLTSDDFIEEYPDNTEGNEERNHQDELVTKVENATTLVLPKPENVKPEGQIPILASTERLPSEGMPPVTNEQTIKDDVVTTTKQPFTSIEYFTTTIANSSPTTEDADGALGSQEPTEEGGAVAAITISAIGVVALIVLVALLYVMRKRQHKRTYGQRCTPVSLDAYSVDSVSVYSSVRGKNRARASKRSYGNPAYNDSGMTSHSMSFPALSNFVSDESAVFAEFTEIPTVTVRADEVPVGCEVKNRYANVMPLPETRVPLSAQPGDETGGYINANYVRGPRGIRNYYIACQAPMQSTVNDFWKMIWEQQAKVILMLTDLYENGVEKCTDYLPPSEVLDCHRLFGDYKVTLKKREVKDKYVISSVQLCNMESGTWREVTHLWYMWPEKGVPKEYQSMIAFLIEARSFMKSPHDKTENNNTSAIKAANQQMKKDTGEQMNVYSPQQAQKAYRKTHRAPTEPPTTNGDANKSNAGSGESSSKSGGPAKTTTTSMSRLSTINEKSPNGSVSEPPSQYSTAPVVVHCSPGTGRTGAVIACDLAIKEFELNRTVDLPKTVYRIRRDRASAVQTKEQYMFIYQVINLYATKLTGGVLDSI